MLLQVELKENKKEETKNVLLLLFSNRSCFASIFITYIRGSDCENNRTKKARNANNYW